MAFSIGIFVASLLLTISFSDSQPSFRPKALVLPVRKDASTLQYLTTINQRTPLVPVHLVVHLGGQFLWVDCDNNYVSSSYRPVRCRSAQCHLARSTACADCYTGPSPRPGCNNNTCGIFPENPITHYATGGQLAEDEISIPSTSGSNPGRAATAPRFIFACGATFFLKGLARSATGVAGLGRTQVGLPAQLAAAFSFKRRFAVCLSSSTSKGGAIFLGDGPYRFLPGLDLSASLMYTPLYVNPVGTGAYVRPDEPSIEYFIGVKTIRINNNPVTVNDTLLTIDGQGNGGTKISTVDPYTVLETSIYRAFSLAYVREAASRNMTRVGGVAPFEVCFSSVNVGSTRVGLSVPYIDLVLQGQKGPVWTITGSNSMVRVKDDVLCLGFLDGGPRPRTAIVIGGYQVENNLLQFDLAASRLGFSGTLLGMRTACANFNFTSNA